MLREIIEAEKEIQQSLERARQETHSWLEARRKESEEECARGESEIETAFRQSREQEKKNAEIAASGLVREAEVLAARIGHLPDGALADIVSRHIHKILPG